ncbi:MAG: hypothetical protein KGH65_01795 [Candidatus Micrarchaeota archaeon]|nr:hypothetical protein [Candidatus Micrarchaeota archaeon]
MHIEKLQVAQKDDRLLRLYNCPPTLERFSSLLTNSRRIEQIANAVPDANKASIWRDEILLKNSYRQPKSMAEAYFVQALVRLHFDVWLEAVYFTMPEINRMYLADIWTNGVIDGSRRVVFDVHGFRKIRQKNAEYQSNNNTEYSAYYKQYFERKEKAYVEKMGIMHRSNPQIYLIVVADDYKEDFKKVYGVQNLKDVCDEFWPMPEMFERNRSELSESLDLIRIKNRIRKLKNKHNFRLEKNREVVENDMKETIKRELRKSVEWFR